MSAVDTSATERWRASSASTQKHLNITPWQHTLRVAAGVAHLLTAVIIPHFVKMDGHERAPTPAHMQTPPGHRFTTPQTRRPQDLGTLPVHILTVVQHLPELLLTDVLHDYHGADPEDVGEAKVDDAICRTVVSAWRHTRVNGR